MATDPSSRLEFEAKKLVLQLRVTLAADRSSVDPVVENVMNIVKELKCANGREDAVELALTEALANAVIHGAKSDPTKIVECDVACDEAGHMLIIVRDPGTGFDPASLPNPCVGENIYAQHGRGIYLINQLMDEVKFHKHGTEIHMVKR